MAKIKSITYCGHSAFLVDCDGITLGIDPWLDGNPVCPAKLRNPNKLDIIVLSHGHSDHAGDVLRLSHDHNSKIVATWELAAILGGEGVPESQRVPMNKGGTIEVSGLKISLTNAFHSSSYESSKRGTLYAGEPCGVIVSDGTTTIYHAGDTALFSDMSLIKEWYKPTIALLPIGDCFTMNPREAAEAAKLIGAAKNVPIHYKTFPLLTGTAEEFSSACRQKGVTPTVLEPGAILALS